MTLEELYRLYGTGSAELDREYSRRRWEKVQEIAEYAARWCLSNVDYIALAESAMDIAEEIGRIEGDSVQGEIASKYTTSHNPLLFDI